MSTAAKVTEAVGAQGVLTDADRDDLQRWVALGKPGPGSDGAYPHFLNRARSQLTWTLRDKPVIDALLVGLSAKFQELENNAWDVVRANDSDLAEGAQLLRLGRVVLADTRPEFSDAGNRALIETAAFLATQPLTWPNLEALFLDLWAEEFYVLQTGSAEMCFALASMRDAFLGVTTQALSAALAGAIPCGVEACPFFASLGPGVFFSDANNMPAHGTTTGFGTTDGFVEISI